MSKTLTDKQKGFVKVVAYTDNATEAVVQNYNVKDRIVAKSMGSENLAKPYIRKAVEEKRKTIADMLPDELLAERHLELLNKREIAYTYINGVKEGELIDQPDTQAVSRGLDMAYKIKSTYAPEKSINLNVNTSPELEAKALKAITKYVRDTRNPKGR